MNRFAGARRPARLEMVGCTDTGRVREHNEDAIACDPMTGIAVLADGMGGYAAGEVASGVAAAQISADLARLKAEYPRISAMDLSTAVRETILRANTQIFRSAKQDVRYSGMGTTLVVAAFTGNVVVLGHAGDSRAYLLRQQRLSQITKDHSLLQEHIDLGLIQEGDASARAVKNLVTRALGVDLGMEPELGTYPVLPGDQILLCSDGLSDMLSDNSIQMILNDHEGAVEAAAHRLVQEANLAGGHDNISVIIVQVNKGSPE